MHNITNDTGLKSASFQNMVTYLKEKLKFDPVTYKHSMNVASMCVQMMKQSDYNINKDLMYYAGLFHDIGKTKVTTAILKKDGKLTYFEFDQMKNHTTQGYKILLKHHFPSEIFLAAHLHHEKYDGTGYPLGLIADEAPIVARIVSICDVFDALTSDRPYRKAYSTDKALKIMTDSSSQFDPDLLTILTTNYSGIIASRI